MKTTSFTARRNVLIKIIKKITEVDKIRGEYLARHIVINEVAQTIEYTGSEAVMKRTIDNALILTSSR